MCVLVLRDKKPRSLNQWAEACPSQACSGGGVDNGTKDGESKPTLPVNIAKPIGNIIKEKTF